MHCIAGPPVATTGGVVCFTFRCEAVTLAIVLPGGGPQDDLLAFSPWPSLPTQPFVESGHFLHNFFPDPYWAIVGPTVFMILVVTILSVFFGLLLINNDQTIPASSLGPTEQKGSGLRSPHAKARRQRCTPSKHHQE